MTRYVVLVWIVVGLAACGGQGGTETPADPSSEVGVSVAGDTISFRNVHADVDFVGDDACFNCHEDQYRGFQEHGMARSYYPLTPENAVEDFSADPLYQEPSDLYYRAFEDEGRFYQEEYRLDAEGRKTHRLVREMDYVMGSGTAARTYMTEHEGRLYELPLTWYTQKATWHFSPGYEEQNKRFDRLIPDRCMACHNSYPETVPFAEGKYTSVPHGIGCERCHGPGALHVDERLASPEPAGEVDNTIVNPEHLSLERRLDVCQQCHLQGTVSILREGRGAFDFRPSEPLAAHVAIFSANTPASSDKIDVISHAERMQQSPCFIATQQQGNPMECVTCHDPHEGFRDQGPSYFNDTCLECHAPDALQDRFATEAARQRHTSEANCFSCHMPKVEAEGAPHASFTDHWIRVVEEIPTAPEPMATHEPVTFVPYFEEEDQQDGAAVYEGMAYVVYGTQQADSLALEQGVTILEAALAEYPEAYGEAHALLGTAHVQLGRVEEAIPALEQAVRINPNIPERLNALAQAYEATNRDPITITRLYRRALSIQPALSEVRVNYGRFLETQGRLDEAISMYQGAIDEQPWLDVAHFNLGTAYLQKNDADRAEDALQRAIQLDPNYATALGNLGLLYASQGQTEQARLQFERAVAAAPRDPVALGNLGTYHLNEGNLERAIALLRRAVQEDPAYLDGLLNLSLAYFRNDEMEQARTYAEQALEVDPDNPQARQILNAIL